MGRVEPGLGRGGLTGAETACRSIFSALSLSPFLLSLSSSYLLSFLSLPSFLLVLVCSLYLNAKLNICISVND